jgi:hypothetical protein
MNGGTVTNQIDTQGMAPAFVPRLKLFMSLDIVGSTAFKQPLDLANDTADKSIRWASTIQGFYNETNQVLNDHWTSLEALGVRANFIPGPRPRLWKTVGDEVIFWKELTGDVELWLTISCWIKTIAKLRETFRDDLGDREKSRLDVKSTLWIAGFPIRNRALVASQDQTTPIEELANFYNHIGKGRPPVDVDFIGPGIDVGFRLSGLSSAKKMTISVDCAYLLMLTRSSIIALESLIEKSDALGTASDFFHLKTGLPVPTKGIDTRRGADQQSRFATSLFLQQFAIFYSGNKTLKGVLGEILYPHFWINVTPADTLVAARDALYADDRKSIDWDRLSTFCDKFYADRARFISKPFINRESSASVENLTPVYQQRHEEFCALFAKEFGQAE